MTTTQDSSKMQVSKMEPPLCWLLLLATLSLLCGPHGAESGEPTKIVEQRLHRLANRQQPWQHEAQATTTLLNHQDKMADIQGNNVGHRARFFIEPSSSNNHQVPSQQQHVIQDHSQEYAKRRHHQALALQQQQQQTAPNSRNEAEVETFYIRKGANGTLPCLPVSPGDSQATMNKIEWFKEEKKLVEAEARHIIVWNTKNTIAFLPETGSLLFRGVTNEDSGEYHCLLTKQATGETEDGVVRFYVQDVPDPPQMPIITAFTQRSVNISWVPSYDYHYSPILHYVIHVREGVNGQWDVANGVMTPDNRTQFEIIGLKPFTTYSFRVLAVNAIGVGEASPESHYIITLRQKPDSKLNIISARNISSTAIKLEWLQPSTKEIHGEFLGFRIKYVQQFHEHSPAALKVQLQQQQQQRYRPTATTSNIPEQPSLDGAQAKEIIVGDTSQTSYVIKGLNTFTLYKFSLQVMNPAGDGPVAEVLAMTDEGVAGPPMDLSVIKYTDTQVKLRWSEPKASNGILQGYQIVLHDISNNLNDTRKLSDPQSTMEHTIGDLTPHTWYWVFIQAYSRKYLGEPSQQVKFRTDVSAPSRPEQVNVSCLSQDGILVRWLRPDKFYSQIDYYYVEYRSDSSGQIEQTVLTAKGDKLYNELLITNLTAMSAYELKVVAATKSSSDPNLVYKSEPSATIRVVLQPNCESYTAYPITESTFNTSLAIGVVCASFALALVTGLLLVWRRHCQAAYYYLDDPQTGSRGTNSPQLSETYDDSEYGSTPVGDWAKHVQKLHSDGDIGFSKEFEQIQKSSQSNLSYEHSQLIENKHKNRYINIVAYDHTRVILRPLPGQKKPGSDYINANFIDGYSKPRAYIGTQGPLVSTFDDYWRMIWEQRVVIIVMITNLQERGRRKCDMYWPKEGTETYGHIQVKMLQEVVMATYTLRTFNAKNLKMKRKIGSERTVYQYHYTNWPDHGVPDHPLPVLSFVKKSAAANPPGAGAIICHCSAGCGRSGTYIVIDAMLKQIRHRESINVVDFLKHIRLQRNYLVQTEEQYIFIHDTLVEAIESGDTEIPAKFIAKYIQLLQTGGCNNQQQMQSLSQKNSSYSIANGFSAPSPNGLFAQPRQQQQALTVSNESTNQQQAISPMANSQSNLLLATNSGGTATTFQSNCKTMTAGGGIGSNTTMSGRSSQSVQSAGQWSLLERQYRLVASFKAKDFNVVSALKPCNKNKNRTLNLIPLEAHRVHITPKPGTDGSDYINATFLMGFSHLREFIVTQHPVFETFSDFWQMVYDHNSQTIVLLTQMNDLLKEFPRFWPQKEDEVDYGSFKVKLIGESTLSTKSSAVATASDVGAAVQDGGLIIQRDFIMRSNQDDYELQTKIIHCPAWPECGGPLGGVFDLIQVVQDATQEQATQQKMHDGLAHTTVTVGQEHEPQNGGPIIVVDKFGGTEAATFAVLTTLYKQIKFEAAVDVYMYAKLAHLRRPGIWSSQDDYLFLYRAIENYSTNMLESESSNRAATPIVSSPAVNFHHHLTMTLDRHRHKSSGAHSLKSSTMRRAPSSSHQQKQQLASHQGGGIRATGDLSNKLVGAANNTQFLVDHNHNHIGPNQQNVNNVGKQLNQQRSAAADQTIQHLKALQHHQHQQQQMSNNSPYNSATSIGTSPHQHLLAAAASNGRSFLQHPPTGPPTADHYLYPMS